MRLQYALTVFVVFVLLPASLIGQDGKSFVPMPTQHIVSQVAVGEGYETVIRFSNLLSVPQSITVYFYKNISNDSMQTEPWVVETVFGSSSTISVNMNGFGAAEIALGPLGMLQVGYAIVMPEGAMQITAKCVTYSDYNDEKNKKITNIADIPVKQTKLAFGVSFRAYQGLAIVNPAADKAANAKFLAFDLKGQRWPDLDREIVFQPGDHFSRFFKEDPFNYPVTAIGSVVVVSDVPLAAIALIYKDNVFSTEPIVEAPWNLDLKKFKIGVVKIVAPNMPTLDNDSLGQRILDMFAVMRMLTVNDMARYNYDPFDLGQFLDKKDGRPIIQEVCLKHPIEEYIDKDTGDLNLWLINKEIPYMPDWQFQMKIYFTRGLNLDGTYYGKGVVSKGGSNNLATSGTVYLNGDTVAAMRLDWFENKNPYVGAVFPEFNNVPLPKGFGRGTTFASWADGEIFLAIHEMLHTAGFYFHNSIMHYWTDRFECIMSGYPAGGAFIDASTQTVLSPLEAFVLSKLPLANASAYDWIDVDRTGPKIEAVGNIGADKTLTLSAQMTDEESGIALIVVADMHGPWPQTYYVKAFGPGDNPANFSLELDLKLTLKHFNNEEVNFTRTNVYVYNQKGGMNYASIQPSL